MSGTSNVGQASVYEAGDQRNAPQSELDQAERHREGKVNSHSTTDASMSSPYLSTYSLHPP
ncbi:hypothetical protein FH972_026063 [Carpinus fangiana]|uniref:Uncharacterized protein n=1 Tax=Carpinus fangiana TaxID=176857 RepID=A0A5N6L377_9ROSI|nr:hypothetical protein FH972_026063 [Carpinus fangiana]